MSKFSDDLSPDVPNESELKNIKRRAAMPPSITAAFPLYQGCIGG